MPTCNKHSLYYKHLIIAVYLSAFEIIIRGVLGQFLGGLCEALGIAIIQGWIYILPLFLLLLYPLKNEKYMWFIRYLVFAQVVYLFALIVPGGLDKGPLVLLFKGIKNFYLPLVIYFVVISSLLTHYENFEEKFLTHVVRIGIIFGVFIIIEALLLLFMPDSTFLSFLRLISFSFKNRAFNLLDEIRPIGLYASMQYSGLLFAILSAICFHLKQRLCGFKPRHLFYFFLTCLLVSTAKTYTFAFILYLIFIAFLSFNVRRFVAVLCVFIAVAAMLYINQDVAGYYHGMIFGESQTRFRMLEKWSELGWYLKNSILPNGFMPEFEDYSNSPIEIPFEYLDGEVYAYKMTYQIGVFGFLMWVWTVWGPLFTVRVRSVLLSPYGGVLFVSFCGLIHYLTVFPIFLFSIVIFARIVILKEQCLIHAKALEAAR